MKTPLPSIPLGTFAGIPIRIHLSIVLLLIIVSGEVGFSSEQSLLFGFVVVASLMIHLLIHLALRSWAGLVNGNRKLILMPFGELGFERIELTNRSKIAIFKAVLSIIAPTIFHLGCAGLIYILFLKSETIPPTPLAQNQLMHIFIIQATLGLLNLLPLEPLDMGRVFRLFRPQKSGDLVISTMSLLRSGQLMTIVIGLCCLWFGSLSGFFICLMILMASFQITIEETALLASVGLCAREVMRPAQSVDSFTHGVTITSALKIAQSSFQDIFPVILQGRVVGVVDRRTLLAAASRNDGGSQYVSALASPPGFVVNPDTPVSEVLTATADGEAVVVTSEGNGFAGLILPENLSNVLIASAIRSQEPPDDPAIPFDE